MIEVHQTEAFSNWVRKLRDDKARQRIQIRIRRLSLGNFGDVKPVGEGVSELRIDYGPGYRVYFHNAPPSLFCCPQAAIKQPKTQTLRSPRRH